MNEYTMQSYFKELCNVHYIAYEQVKRLKSQKKELAKYNREDELNVTFALLYRNVSTEIKRRVNYSDEELNELIESLTNEQSEYERKMRKLEDEYLKWITLENSIYLEICKAIEIIKQNNYKIIVLSEKQIIVLISYFAQNGFDKNKIINTKEEFMQLFPTDENGICEEFLKAYLHENDLKMKILHDKYC